MSDTTNAAPQGTQQNQMALKDLEAVRDLFARAHDYIAQATYPGHMGMKIAEVLNFLAFQNGDFKLRCENLKKQMDSSVDVQAAKATADEAAEAPKV